ncbi:ankyrin repeat and protein kinase domain-containing protein 1-like isoform X2 [Huso huso]|uniref:Ankyrin repeat and protein kinase domain-containing protein 1-like isoform X2 n=1 Tax=Huso huso TaxID=61971 RepID=A0ABR0Y9G7_HUSHU
MALAEDKQLKNLKIFNKGDFHTDWVRIASGGFGHVYKVKHKLWRETFAVKCCSGVSYDSGLYRTMIEEASKMEKMKFRYIVPVYGICNDPPAIVMEYMENGSLDQILPTHSLMWAKKFEILHEVALGMNFLHSATPPLLHLDLKPGNILLDENLHARISDFGLSKWKECSSRMEYIELSAIRGTLSYIPPEMFLQNSKPPGTKNDVYSFAIVIWEVLTQKRPYSGANMMTVIVKVAAGRRPCMEDVPEDRPQECEQMINLMQRCWCQEARRRPCFADITKETEVLSEMLKTPNLGQRPNEKAKTHQLLYCKTSNSIKVPKMAPNTEISNESDEEGSEKDIISTMTKRHLSIFKKMLKEVHVTMVFEDNYSLLHYAVATGDTEIVKQVLSFGAKVDSQSVNGYTPLIIAALYKYPDLCSLLIEHKADVNLSDEDKWTPLHFAAQNGDDKIVRLLLDSNADVNAKERDGWAPLHLASQNGHENVVRVLLLRRAAIDLQENENRTALHIAAAFGHINILKLLLSQGADLNKKQKGCQTALHLASEKGHFRVARLLVKSGADLNSTDSNHYTVLHMAALKGYNGICRHLLKHCANPNLKTMQGWTPLHLAAFNGHAVTVRLLKENHAKLNVRGDMGWTPLLLATRSGQEEVISELLEAGADPNVAEESGWTPLHLAIQRGSFLNVLKLIDHRANVNARNRFGWTPLHIAALKGNAPIAKALLMNRAELTEDSNGCTALQLAVRNQKESIVKLLEDALDVNRDPASHFYKVEHLRHSLICITAEHKQRIKQASTDFTGITAVPLRCDVRNTTKHSYRLYIAENNPVSQERLPCLPNC